MQPRRVLRPTDLPQFASLKHSDFRNTWLAGMCSGSAMWTFIIATSWIVYEASGTSRWVGITTFAGMIPFLVVSPVGGLLGDVFDRRRLSLFTFVIGGVVVGAMAVLAANGLVILWVVALFALVNGTVRSVQEPSMAALVPNQVPRRTLLNALVLTSSSRHGARFFGLLVAAPLLDTDSRFHGLIVGLLNTLPLPEIEALGVEAVLVLSVAFQLCGGLLMTRVRTVSTGETRSEHGVLGNIVDGLVHIYTNHTLALFIILVAFHCALVMSFESMMPVFSNKGLGASGPSVFNNLMMGFGAGSLVGMMAMAGVQDDRIKGRILLTTGVASAVTPVMLAFSPNVAVAVFLAGVMGAAQATFMALSNTYVQMMVPDGLRARISSLYILHAGGVMAFANLGYGFLADQFSAPPILIVTGVLFLAVVVALSANQPVLRQVYRTGRVAMAW